MLKGRASHLGRIDDAGRYQVFVGIGGGIVAEVGVVVGADLIHDDGAFGAGVGDDLANRLFAGALHDGDADLLVAIHLEAGQGLGCAQ